MFVISKTPLEELNLRAGFKSEKAGAFNSFEGIVRNHNNRREVSRLEYEADEKLCELEAKNILLEAHKNFNIIGIHAFHRVGVLSIGEMAVWVGVWAAHRDDAFKACRYVIDELKERLPIWKKEYYTDGESNWINPYATLQR